MKAYLIDPMAVKISEVEVDEHDILGSLYRLIGCSMVEVFPYGHDDIWLDEEGLYKAYEGHPCWTLDNLYDQVFVGRGVVLGRKPGPEGVESVAPSEPITLYQELFYLI